jgi:hypothetical protein
LVGWKLRGKEYPATHHVEFLTLLAMADTVSRPGGHRVFAVLVAGMVDFVSISVAAIEKTLVLDLQIGI